MKRAWLVVVVAAACGPKPGSTAPGSGSGSASPPVASVTLDDKGVVPMDRGGILVGETTHVTLSSLRAALVGFDVTPTPSGLTTVFRVSRRGGPMLYEVVPNSDGTIASIDALSAGVDNPAHNWRVGDKLKDLKQIDQCACWTAPDAAEHAACFKNGERVAVVYVRPCDIDDPATAQPPLLDTPIQSLVWVPIPWSPADPAME